MGIDCEDIKSIVAIEPEPHTWAMETIIDSTELQKSSIIEQIGNDDHKQDTGSNKEEEPLPSNGAKWIHLLGADNIGTSSFDTRIDYVLANQKMMSLFDVVEYEHWAHGNASDHKFVRARFVLKSES